MSEFIRPEYEPIIKSTIRVYHDEIIGRNWHEIKDTIEKRISGVRSDVYNRIDRFQKGTLPLSPKIRGYIGDKTNLIDSKI